MGGLGRGRDCGGARYRLWPLSGGREQQQVIYQHTAQGTGLAGGEAVQYGPELYYPHVY